MRWHVWSAQRWLHFYLKEDSCDGEDVCLVEKEPSARSSDTVGLKSTNKKRLSGQYPKLPLLLTNALLRVDLNRLEYCISINIDCFLRWGVWDFRPRFCPFASDCAVDCCGD